MKVVIQMKIFDKFLQNVKIRKAKTWVLEELKMLLRVVEERTSNIHKS